MRTFLCTAGTSVFQLRRDGGPPLLPGTWTSELNQQLIDRLGRVRMRDASAEITTLGGLEANPDDEVVLLATDTEEGELAASMVGRLTELLFGSVARVVRIPALDLGRPLDFRRQGLPQLVQTVDDLVTKASSQGRRPLLSIAGGTKTMVAYLSVYGMLRGVPIAYSFESGPVRIAKAQAVGAKGQSPDPPMEWKPTLVMLPRIPITFDWQALSLAGHALAAVERDTALPAQQVRSLLGDNFDRMEGLFEDLGGVGGALTLSPFGLLLLGDLRRIDMTRVWLSPHAVRAREEGGPVTCALYDICLGKLRNPQLRATHLHPFRGTDLSVFKPGNTAHRVAYWAQGDNIYVAELYGSHDRYEADLNGRRRADYPTEDFIPWEPREEGIEETLADDPVQAAQRAVEQERLQKHKLSADLDASMALAEDRERALAEITTRLHEAEEQLSDACADNERLREEISQAQMSLTNLAVQKSWGLWRRLKWAAFRS